jgi:uncharacterized protein YegP (UPF0339 family)
MNRPNNHFKKFINMNLLCTKIEGIFRICKLNAEIIAIKFDIYNKRKRMIKAIEEIRSSYKTSHEQNNLRFIILADG